MNGAHTDEEKTDNAAAIIAAALTASIRPWWQTWIKSRNKTSDVAVETASLTARKDHPWWQLCAKLDNNNDQLALQRLELWLEQGISPESIPAILEAHQHQGVGDITKTDKASNAHLTRVSLHCFGTDWLDWQTHAWLQRCDLPNGFELTDNADVPRIALNFESEAYWLSHPLALQELTLFTTIWDPDPTRVKLLRAFGIRAEQLHIQRSCNGWLDRPTDGQDAMLTLGLPDPQSLAGPESVLVLGRAEASASQQVIADVYEWPGFDEVRIANEDNARLLAHWLERCSRLGIQIVRLQPTAEELKGQGFASLSLVNEPRQLKTQYFHGALHLSALKEELEWRRNGRQLAVPTQTPSANSRIIWEANNSSTTAASVCISLYNYQQKICTALESVKSQSQPDIELIIIDDASTDQSAELTRQWLQANHHCFSRSVLIQHTSNAGLAAARNSAFLAASAEWCFVLDADNFLHPQAVEQCLRVAKYTPEKIAVIHPLIRLSSSNGNTNDDRRLISGQSWQQQLFTQENYIDAMALIRKSSWVAVNGYDHIEDGWEDYDFWCKLIEQGFHGVLCPQALATYISHDQSMIHSRTNRNVRRISRSLQARHPWLNLPMARHDA